MSSNRIKLLIALVVALVLLCTACDNQETASTEANENSLIQYEEHKKIIVDCDGGADDATALICLAQADNIELLGVTCLEGNSTLENVGNSVLMDLEIAGKKDVDVYLGENLPDHELRDEIVSVYGKDGMGEQDLIHPSGKPSDVSAVDFIINTVKDNPDEIEIVVLGPATNIATAITKDPETMSHVKRYWIMGTAGYGTGNATPVAEFNVYTDAEAFATLIDNDIEKIIVPFDVCLEAAEYTAEDMEELKEYGPKGQYLAKAFTKLLEYNKQSSGRAYANICDATTAALLIDPNIADEYVDCSAVCITEEGYAYGMVIFYDNEKTYESELSVESNNIKLVTHESQEKLRKLIKGKLQSK